jgi:hypothetical protein
LYGRVFDQLGCLSENGRTPVDGSQMRRSARPLQRHNQERPGAPFVDERNKWCKAALVPSRSSIRDVNLRFVAASRHSGSSGLAR